MNKLKSILFCFYFLKKYLNTIMKNTLKTCGQVRNYSGATWPKKEDVPERNLELPYSNNSNKLFWMDIDFSKFNEYNL